jgi:hypothetical protein
MRSNRVSQGIRSMNQDRSTEDRPSTLNLEVGRDKSTLAVLGLGAIKSSRNGFLWRTATKAINGFIDSKQG